MPTMFILIGPAGVGKNTVQEAILARWPDIAMPRGVITRPLRPNENADSDSISVPEFTHLLIAGELAGVAEVHGNFYGTPKFNIRYPLSQGRDVLRILNVNGADRVREEFPDTKIVTIFLAAPLKILRERMEERGDAPDVIERRLQTAQYELARQYEWDYLVDAVQPPEAVSKHVAAIIGFHRPTAGQSSARHLRTVPKSGLQQRREGIPLQRDSAEISVVTPLDGS